MRARYASSPDQINELRSQIDQLSKELEEARVNPPPQSEGFAKGSEKFRIRFVYSEYFEEPSGRLLLSWDQIFATVGPTMFDEAPESELRRQLEKKVSADQKIEEEANVSLNEEDFQTIKVQLLALGLIAKSIRKRGVRDPETYWTLTRYGENYATVLKAIRASNTPGA